MYGEWFYMTSLRHLMAQHMCWWLVIFILLKRQSLLCFVILKKMYGILYGNFFFEMTFCKIFDIKSTIFIALECIHKLVGT